MRRQMTSPFWEADILTEEFVANVANSNREYTRRYDQFGPMPHDYRGSDKIYIYAWYGQARQRTCIASCTGRKQPYS